MRSRVGGAVWRARRDEQLAAGMGHEEAAQMVVQHLLAINPNDVFR